MEVFLARLANEVLVKEINRLENSETNLKEYAQQFNNDYESVEGLVELNKILQRKIFELEWLAVYKYPIDYGCEDTVPIDEPPWRMEKRLFL